MVVEIRERRQIVKFGLRRSVDRSAFVLLVRVDFRAIQEPNKLDGFPRMERMSRNRQAGTS
jgi:hypothetical protein